MFSPENGYFDKSTRVHFIQFSLYQRLTDYFIAVEIMVEFSISGMVYPSSIKIFPFKPNVFELSQDKGLQATDIFRLVLCLHLVYSIYRKVKYHWPKE